jgi:hypothetical protein
MESSDQYEPHIDAERSPDEPLCDECGHPEADHHWRYGCEVERGDDYVLGTLQAMGPCGCRAVKVYPVGFAPGNR